MSVSIDSSDSKKLYIRVEFLNRLSEFLNEHAEVYPAIHALPTKSLKKIQKRRKIIKNSITHCLSLTMHIPESEDSDFIADTTRYLKLICAQLISADERYSHLEAWSHGNERYSLSQDAAYMKHIRNIEGEIALCGRLMNSYKYGCLLAIHPERALEIGRLIKRNAR